MARWTAAGSLARGVRQKPQSRSQLRVSVGLAPTSPVPGPRSGNRTQHPGCAQPLSRGHVSRRDERTTQPRATTVGVHAASRARGRAPRGTRASGWCGRWPRPRASQLAPSPVYVALVIGIAVAGGVDPRPPGPVRAGVPAARSRWACSSPSCACCSPSRPPTASATCCSPRPTSRCRSCSAASPSAARSSCR